MVLCFFSEKILEQDVYNIITNFCRVKHFQLRDSGSYVE